MPNPLPPALVDALKKISSNINPSTGLGHPLDMEKTTRWLAEAIQEMNQASHPDEVSSHLVGLGQIGGGTARDVALINEALWCHLKGRDPSSS